MGVRFIDEASQPVKPVTSTRSKVRFIDEEQAKPSLLDFIGIAQDVAPSPTTLIQRGLDAVAEKTAEFGGRMGHPKMGAAAGTAISMAPELLGAGTTFAAMERSPSPLARAIRTTPEEFNAEFRAGEKAAGITDEVPVQRGAMARFPPVERVAPTKQPIPVEKAQPLPSVKPVSYPKDTPSFVNFAKARIRAFGNRLTPKEVDDYAKVATNTLDNLESKGMRKTPLFAAVSDLKTMAVNLRNEVVSGRADLNKAYKLSLIPGRIGRAVVRGAGKVMGSTIGKALTLGGAGAYAAKKVLEP